MKDQLLLLRNQLKMGHRISFAEAMLLQRAIDILVNKAGNSPAQSDCCPAQNSATPAQDGNSPVVPDGYVLVPKEATLEMIKSGASAASNGMLIPGIYKAMLAAADCSIPMISDRWIPVSEQMPDENAEQQVLACFKGGDISTLYYFEGHWDDAYGIVPIRQDVTHWMPLPAAPQEVK
ncbi:hypothetical protein BCY82_05440 [Klebsiella quasipneumoniae]|nr:DUF551 domain-containing protein [Klebsiella quasipneumoniae]OED24468.1 hypothetical protein BCY82_05440 [Klebsiella quasipneumoniae]